MALLMIDSHCHIDLPIFEEDRTEVLKRASDAGITRILVPGLYNGQVTQLLQLKMRYSMLDIAAGFHPYFLKEMAPSEWHAELNIMSNWLESHKKDVVGIGEFGLDSTLALSQNFQQRIFVDQLCLAKRMKKPVILHHRKSHNDIIRLLKQHKFTFGGVIHAFSGSEQIARTYIDMGFKLGVGGTITYPRGEKTRNALKQVPLTAMLLETDAPDMPLYGYQGIRNEPNKIKLVAEKLAQVKGTSVDEVARVTTANYMSLFSSKSAP